MNANRTLLSALIFTLYLNCSYGGWLDVQHSSPSTTSTTNDAQDLCKMHFTKDGTSTLEDTMESIQCTCTDKVVDCSALYIESLPLKLSIAQNHQIVTFKDNIIKDIRDGTFYSGKDVTELDLSNNQITFISIKSFEGFPNLKRLMLNHNQFWELPDGFFSGLNQLRVLDLSYNSIKTLRPSIFEHLSELRELKLEDNPLHEYEPKLFEHLGKLEILDLESTIVHNISDFLFSFTPNLKTLILSDNQLEKVPSTAVKTLKNLKTLDLSGNRIVSIGSQAFLGLETLTRLHLNRMPVLQKIQRYAFGDLTKLRELYCSYNYLLSEIEDGAFTSRETGKQLDLNQIFLSENSLGSIPADLQRSSSVKLHADGNPWNCCKLKWTMHTTWTNEIRCNAPSNVQGKMLSSIEATDLLCEEISTASTMFLIGLAVVATIILVTVLGCFMLKKRWLRPNPSYFRVFKKTDVDEVVYERSFRPEIT